MATSGSVRERLNGLLDVEALALTEIDAVGRSPTYRRDTALEGRRRFWESHDAWLVAHIGDYRAEFFEQAHHVARIEALSAELSKARGEVLLDGRLPTGVVFERVSAVSFRIVSPSFAVFVTRRPDCPGMLQGFLWCCDCQFVFIPGGRFGCRSVPRIVTRGSCSSSFHLPTGGA